MKDLSKRAKEIIEHIRYITIASVTENGMPWNSPVFAAYDKYYNFYFGTHTESQKAKNIKNNPNVFLAIYDSTVPPGTGEGVYIQATVQQINDTKEIKRFNLKIANQTTRRMYNYHVNWDEPVKTNGHS